MFNSMWTDILMIFAITAESLSLHYKAIFCDQDNKILDPFGLLF